MKVRKSSHRKGIWIFLLITVTLSSAFNFLIIKSGHVSGGGGIYLLGLMWSPGAAAILTLKIQKRNISELGWNWGRMKYQLWAYGIPIIYAGVTYVIVWITGLGGFYNIENVQLINENLALGELDPILTIVLYCLLNGTLGMARSAVGAVGEEIGWRGFLVPELLNSFSFTQTSLIIGIIWALWHYPILIFADYNSGVDIVYGLICFTIMVVSISFIFTWMRLKSNSLWSGVILHASHNLFIQAIFTPLTTDTGYTKYFIDEFGLGLCCATMMAAIYFWVKRKELPIDSRKGDSLKMM